MKCTNCGQEQSVGKFCGKCGHALSAVTVDSNEGKQSFASENPNVAYSQAIPAYQAPVEPNQHVKKVKDTSKQYWSYFLRFVKSPSAIFDHPTAQWINALITIAVFALITSLVIYRNINVVMNQLQYGMDDFISSSDLMPSFFQVLLNSAITVAIIFGLSIVSIFLVSKFAGPAVTLKQIASSFGTLLIPFTIVMLAGYLLLLIDSLVIGNFLFSAGLMLAVLAMPLFIMTTLLKEKSQLVDPFYAFLAYIVLFSISLSIVISIFFDSTIGQYIETLSDSFYF